MSQIDNTIQNTLSFLDNESVHVGVSVALAVYTAFLAPVVAARFGSILNNQYVMLLLVVLVGLVSRKDTTIALLLGMAILMTFYTMSVLSVRSVSVVSSVSSDSDSVSSSTLLDTGFDTGVSGVSGESGESGVSGVSEVDSNTDNTSLGSSGEDYQQVGVVERTSGMDTYSDSAAYATA
jgi:hypothetical protein